MPFRYSFPGSVRRRYLGLSATTLLFVALGCGETDSPTEPSITSTPEVAPQFAVSSNTWISRRDMPLERFGVATATVPNAAGQSILYAIGGQTSSRFGSLSRVQAYNVATNTWSYKAALPTPLRALNGAGVIDGKVYVAGGIAGGEKGYSQALYVYDPAANSWSRKRDMPTNGFDGFTGVIGNKLYLVTFCTDFDWCAFPGRWLLRYDPLTDSWTELATPPRDAGGGIGGTIGNKFYVGDYDVEPNVLDVYDPATDAWTRRTTNLAVRNGAASTVLGAKLYMIGGSRRNADGTLTPVRTTSVYDPGTNRWTNVAPLPRTRGGAAAARVFLNGRARIELVGGTLPGNNLQYTP